MFIGFIISLIFGSLVTGPGMWENLPTCNMDAPIVERCREVRGQWGGTVDGRIHDDSSLHERAER